MIFTCNPSGFRKFRSLHIQFVELEQIMMQQLGLHEAPTNNLKNIMVITALSNIPDVRQDVYVQAKRTADFDSMESWWLYVVCSREYHKYKENLHTAIGKFTFRWLQ